MAAPRGRRGTARAREQARETAASATRNEGAGLVPELLRRALGLGFSGLFTTEELLRKAFGDSVPREWVEFAAAQTDRARRELIERLSAELQRKLDQISPEELLAQLMRGHTVEVEARIRFLPREEES